MQPPYFFPDGSQGPPLYQQAQAVPFPGAAQGPFLDQQAQAVFVQPGEDAGNGKRESVALSSLPPEIRNLLAVYDVRGDGFLHPDEMARMKTRIQNEQAGRLHISDFPAKHREELLEFDDSGDQMLDTGEIVMAFSALKRERQKSAELKKWLIALAVTCFVMLAAVSALTALVVHLSKESHIQQDVMVSSANGAPVQTASADFQLEDGVLQTRSSTTRRDDGTCDGPGSCESTPITVTSVQKKESAVLSSELNDEDLRSLDELTIQQLDSFIHIKINAVARYPEPASRHGSVVVLYSSLGELSLDGEAIFFHERLDGAFSRAGFTVDQDSPASGRRLLGAVQILGLFNSLNKAIAKNSSGDGDADLDVENVPLTFIADVTILSYCDETEGCAYDGQPIQYAVNTHHGKQAMQTFEKSYSQTVNGAFKTKTITTSPQYPLQEKVTVQNTSHKLTYQVFDGQKYFCSLVKDDELERNLARRSRARRVGPATADVAEFHFAGYTTINGIYCRHLKVCEEAMETVENVTFDDNNTETARETVQVPSRMCYNVFENYFTKKIYQLEVFDAVLYQFNSLAEVLDEAYNPLSPAEVDLDGLLSSCSDSSLRQPPAQWDDRLTLTPVLPEPTWGQPLSGGGNVYTNSTADTAFDSIVRSLEISKNNAESRHQRGNPPRVRQYTLAEYDDHPTTRRSRRSCKSNIGFSLPTIPAFPVGLSFTAITDCDDPSVNLFTEFKFWSKIGTGVDPAVAVPNCPGLKGEILVRVYPNGDLDIFASFTIKVCIITCILGYNVPFIGIALAQIITSAGLPDVCAIGNIGVGYKDFREASDFEWDEITRNMGQGGPQWFDEVKDLVPKMLGTGTNPEVKYQAQRPIFGGFEAIYIAGSVSLATPATPVLAQGDLTLSVQFFQQLGCGEAQIHTKANHYGVRVEFSAGAWANLVFYKASVRAAWQLVPGLLQQPPKTCEWERDNDGRIKTDTVNTQMQKECRWISPPEPEGTSNYPVYNFKTKPTESFRMSSWVKPLDIPMDDAPSKGIFSGQCYCWKGRDRMCSLHRGDYKSDFQQAPASRLQKNTWWGVEYGNSVLRNGKFRVEMQSDCNMVIYENSADTNRQDFARWGSDSWVPEDQRPCKAIIFPDGHMVIRNKNDEDQWSSGTWNAEKITHLELQRAGSLFLKRDSGVVEWAVLSTEFETFSSDEQVVAVVPAPNRLNKGVWWNSGDTDLINGDYRAALQSDCNLVVYQNDVWRWGTEGSWVPEDQRPCHGILFDDGQLVIRDKDGVDQWSSGTWDTDASVLELESDGQLRLKKDDGTIVWFSEVGDQPSLLLKNTWWNSGDADLTNGEYRAVMQSDCNLVVYQNSAYTNNEDIFKWGTRDSWVPEDQRPCHAIIFDDGQLVIRDKDGMDQWSSGTWDSGASRLVLEGDGSLRLKKDNGDIVCFTAGQHVWTCAEPDDV